MAVKFADRLKVAFQVLRSGKAKEWQFNGFTFAKSTPNDYSVSAGAAHAGKTAIVAACLTAWTREYKQAPFKLVDKDGSAIYDHPVLDLVKHPGRNTEQNEWLDEQELKILITTYRLLTGMAYVELVMNKQKIPIGLDVWSKLHLKPIATKTKRIAHYERAGEPGSVVPVENIIRLPWDLRDPSNVTLGISPLQACFTDAESYQEVGLFVSEFLKNGAFPGTMVFDKTGDNDAARRASNKAQFVETFGAGNRGGVGYFQGDMSIQAFAHGLKDLDLSALRDTPEASICAAFGVPAELVGAKLGLEMAHLNNKKEARKAFTQSVLASAWVSDAASISAVVCKALGFPELKLEYDLALVPAMREDADARVLRAQKMFVDGAISRDEYRASDGYAAFDNADVFSYQLKPKDAAQKDVKAIGDNTEEERELVLYWKAQDDELQGYIDKLHSSLLKAVNELQDQLRKEVGKKGISTKADYDALSDENLQKIFIESTEADREEIILEMVKRAAGSAGFDYNKIKTWLDESLEATLKESASKISISQQTVKDELVEILSNTGRSTPGQIVEALSKYFDMLGSSRIMTIAQTTSTAARSRAQNDSWTSINKRRKDGKVISKRWISQRDGKVRDTHKKADDQARPMGELFNVGSDEMEAPGLGALPEENINCRCVLLPKTTKKD